MTDAEVEGIVVGESAFLLGSAVVRVNAGTLAQEVVIANAGLGLLLIGSLMSNRASGFRIEHAVGRLDHARARRRGQRNVEVLVGKAVVHAQLRLAEIDDRADEAEVVGETHIDQRSTITVDRGRSGGRR